MTFSLQYSYFKKTDRDIGTCFFMILGLIALIDNNFYFVVTLALNAKGLVGFLWFQRDKILTQFQKTKIEKYFQKKIQKKPSSRSRVI